MATWLIIGIVVGGILVYRYMSSDGKAERLDEAMWGSLHASRNMGTWSEEATTHNNPYLITDENGNFIKYETVSAGQKAFVEIIETSCNDLLTTWKSSPRTVDDLATFVNGINGRNIPCCAFNVDEAIKFYEPLYNEIMDKDDIPWFWIILVFVGSYMIFKGK